MKDPTGILGVDISPELAQQFGALSKADLDEFLQRCKFKEYQKLDAATTPEERLTVQVRVKFVEEWRKFFQNLLTKPQN